MTGTPKTCGAGHRCQVETLGELLYCVVHHSDLPPKQIADRLDMRVGYLLDAANPDREDTQFQLRKFRALLEVTGRFDAMEWLAGQLGGVFFRMPAERGGVADVLTQTARVVREFGDVVDESATALKNRRVSPLEARRLTQQGRELIAETAKLIHLANDEAGVATTPLQFDERRSA